MAHTQPSSHALDTAPALQTQEGRYRLRFARTRQDVEAALRLRYEVFNLELGEGLAASAATGLDEDVYDEHCHHMLVEIDGRVVGTYRMQTAAMAAAGQGFYSAGEYDLTGMGDDVLSRSVEVGRACIHVEHRRQKVLFALWRGLAAYLSHFEQRYFFGCCSLTSQDATEGLATMEHLRRQGLVLDDRLARARADFTCEGPAPEERAVAAIRLPTLFSTYMRFGARVCSDPAIDRAFKTIDFLVLMDTRTLPETVRRMFGIT